VHFRAWKHLIEQLQVMAAASTSSPIPSDGRNLTILLIGETGVGKSTWINTFANILQYESFATAVNSPICNVIPTYFSITNQHNERQEIRIGSDENECFEVGQSATQIPRTYTFTQNTGRKIRLIDTPGLGDVRGIKQDKKNFQLILDHISQLNCIDGICVLLKPNIARLNVVFTFCIKELLTQLHRDASKNIVFCFTNSRGTFYRPGDTFDALKVLLNQNGCSDILLNPHFCIDNESLRLLYALKQNVEFCDEEIEAFEKSWNKTCGEMTRMLAHFSNLQPHEVNKTLSLNNVRQMILGSNRPLLEISHTINLNIVQYQRLLANLYLTESSAQHLSSAINRKKVELKCISFPEPRTTCASKKCFQSQEVDVGETKFSYPVYKQFCHENCSSGKKKQMEIIGVIGHKSLRNCSAFSDGKCLFCGCSWEYHVKILNTSELVISENADESKQKHFEDENQSILMQKQIINELKKDIDEFKNEQKQIMSSIAKFGSFLKQNSIRAYNDSSLQYLEHLMDQEKDKVQTGGDRSVLQELCQMREDFEKEYQLIKNAVKSGSVQHVSAEEIQATLIQLYEMKHYGKALRNFMTAHSKLYRNIFYTEKQIFSKKLVQQMAGQGLMSDLSKNNALLTPYIRTFEKSLSDLKSFVGVKKNEAQLLSFKSSRSSVESSKAQEQEVKKTPIGSSVSDNSNGQIFVALYEHEAGGYFEKL